MSRVYVTEIVDRLTRYLIYYFIYTTHIHTRHTLLHRSYVYIILGIVRTILSPPRFENVFCSNTGAYYRLAKNQTRYICIVRNVLCHADSIIVFFLDKTFRATVIYMLLLSRDAVCQGAHWLVGPTELNNMTIMDVYSKINCPSCTIIILYIVF